MASRSERARPLTQAEAGTLAAALVERTGPRAIEVVEQAGGWMVRVRNNIGVRAVAQMRRDFTGGWPASQVATVLARARL